MDKELWKKAVEFHGHACPGLAVGFKACEAAIEKMGLKYSSDEEIVCVTENDACGVDAIQAVLGCTFGKGNLVYRGTGKMAYTFFNRTNGDRLRIVEKDFEEEDMGEEELQQYILNEPAEQLFDFKKPIFELPEEAGIFDTVICEKCGEGAPERKIRLDQGKKVCLDCFRDYSRGW